MVRMPNADASPVATASPSSKRMEIARCRRRGAVSTPTGERRGDEMRETM